MGFFSSVIKNPVKTITSTVGNFVKNPIKSTTNSLNQTVSDIKSNPIKNVLAPYIGMSSGGILGAVAADKLVKAYQQDLPNVNIDTNARNLQGNLIKGQLGAADEYSQNLGQNINEEADAARSVIGSQLNDANRATRSAANARGMLFSGRRMAEEGRNAADAAGRLADARSEIIRRATGQEQAFYAQPLRSQANVAEANTQQQGLLDQYRQQTDAQKNALVSGGMGLIGQGLGQGLANKRANLPFAGRSY